MAQKTNKKLTKKKPSKIDPLAYEKSYLTNIINHLQMCAEQGPSAELRAYFQSKADLNRERLKALK